MGMEVVVTVAVGFVFVMLLIESGIEFTIFLIEATGGLDIDSTGFEKVCAKVAAVISCEVTKTKV